MIKCLGVCPGDSLLLAAVDEEDGQRDEGDSTQGQRKIEVAAFFDVPFSVPGALTVLGVTGLGLVRPLGESDDSRLVHGQLITIRRRGGGAVWVGTIQWLQEALNGDLLVGARLVPGIPSAISIRRLGEDAFVPALLLDPIPALNAPTSLLVPFGTFAPQRVVEVHRRGIERLQLTGLLEAGGDYERVAFMPVGR